MKRILPLIFLFLLFEWNTSSATIINIPADFPAIQQGIDASSDGDTVLVQPGTYVENINFNGHNIVLGSLFLTTEDTSFISTTVIDGDSAGTVVTFEGADYTDAILAGFTITNGRATNGAAILCSINARPVIENNYIRNNNALARGGGIYCDSASSPRIYYNVFGLNHGQYGGGAIYLYGSLGSNISNNLFYLNTSEDGGAICSRNSNFTLLNNTITLNNALGDGGGIYCWQNTSVEAKNTILWDNHAAGVDQVFISNTSTAIFSYCDIQDGWEGVNNIDIDPLFRDGAAEDFRLMSTNCEDSTNSPCIDAGYPGIADLVLNCSWGLGDTTSDMGAFGGGAVHSGPGHIINVPQDYSLIQSAILASWHNDTVLVQPGSYYENINFYGRNITLASTYIVNGDTSSINSTIINGGYQDHVVRFINDEDSTASLIGFTIRGGQDSTGWGGGIYIYYTSPLISHNRIEANRARRGGGIACVGSNAKIENNIIGYNTALGEPGMGGGIFCDGPNSAPRILNNRVTDNYSDGPYGKGGGIFCRECSPVIYHNDISRNMINFFGGAGAGAYFEECEVMMSNNVIFGNSISGQPSDGAGIEFYATSGFFFSNVVVENHGSRFGGLHFGTNSAPLVVENSIIWHNTPYQITTSNSPLIELSYCDIQDTLWPGLGNISIDPLFRDPADSNFHLMSLACGDSADSPCIDAGDPDILDSLLDCSWGLGAIRSDMGAYGGGEIQVSIGDPNMQLPEIIALAQNYPNPFNAQTTIRFTLPKPQDVRLTIYDLLGRQVETLLNEYMQAGAHTVTFDASHLSSGVYFYRLQAGEAAGTKRMVLLR